MNSKNLFSACLLAGLLLALTASPSLALDKIEQKCASKLSGAAGKTATAVAKALSSCRDDVVAGDIIGPCPDAGAQAAIDKAKAKIVSTAEKSCSSKCSISEVECISSATCPPRDGASNTEACTTGAGKGFEASNLGFPGAFCEEIVGGRLESSTDIGSCVASLTGDIGAQIIDAVYGDVDAGSGLTDDAASCLSSTSKAFSKMIGKINKSVGKCAASFNKGKGTIEPSDCLATDAKTLDTVVKTRGKLDKTLAKKCTDGQIATLDLCGQGIGGVLTTAAAGACLEAIALELVDAGDTMVVDRTLASPSLFEAASPPKAVCGDGVINQLPDAFVLIGEECDGASDDLCPGECFPPGDLFECTCSTIKRVRFFADGTTADLDNGWTGASHDGGVADGSGFISTLSDCDCDDMEGQTCVGSTVDSLCNRSGNTQPTCSHDLFGGTRCDDAGNVDGKDEDLDCYICDPYAVNAGDFCSDSRDCDSQCYDSEGSVVGSCDDQADCPEGSRCRGACDQEQTCVKIPLGGPLPLSSAGVPTCLTTVYDTEAFGEQDFVTGEGATFTKQITLVHSGLTVSRPCPVCGGYCVGGRFAGDPCDGTCSISGDRCRFDSECPNGETCTSDSPIDCPGGGTCELELKCFGGPNDGEDCRLYGDTELFGTTSPDCPPDPNANFSGDGLLIEFFPATTEVVELEATIPCTAQGFGLFDCHCPDGGAFPSKPNACNAACDAGPELGQGCANRSGTGDFTRCAAGVNVGQACDEDADCPGSSCSSNPMHCTGDFAFNFESCSSNGDCGSGTCVDACPSGRCVPLCIPDPEDNQDGICASGPTIFNCQGTLDRFRVCAGGFANGSCSATCENSNNPCTGDADCDPGEACTGPCALAGACEAGNDAILGTADDIPGAGICGSRQRSCFLPTIFGEGGDVLNGRGDPTNSDTVTAYCVAPTSSSAINNSVGLGGPSRLRQMGTNLTNGFETLP